MPKRIYGSVYVHKSKTKHLPSSLYSKAYTSLRKNYPRYRFDVVKYNKITGAFSFIKTHNWKAKNPVVSQSICIRSSSNIKLITFKNKSKAPLYHRKELFMQ